MTQSPGSPTQCLNSQRLSSATREAEPMLAVLPQELDANPHLLNFRNGTLDLRTLNFSAHSQAQLITKIVHHDYNRGELCPTYLHSWNAFWVRWFHSCRRRSGTASPA